MKNKKRYLQLLLVCSLIAIGFTSSLMFFGLNVASQRNSGPDLYVISGSSNLKAKCGSLKVNYFDEVFTNYEFDNDSGFEQVSDSYVFIDIIGTKPISENSKFRAAIIDIKYFYPKYLVIGIFTLSLLCCIIILIKMRKKKHQIPS